jgi:hypothetical protein
MTGLMLMVCLAGSAPAAHADANLGTIAAKFARIGVKCAPTA